MILERTIAPVFAANCYVLADGPDSPALVVDPGAGSVRGALALLRSNRLTLGAVLLTHGHADHVWDTAALIDAARAEGIAADGEMPVYVPEPDRYRLDDPDTTTGIRSDGETFADLAGSPWTCPAGIHIFPGEGFSRAVELVPGIAVQAVPAPGHSEGSTIFFLNARLADNDLLREAEVRLTSEEIYIPLGPPIRWSLVRGDLTGFAENGWGIHPLPPLAERPI